MLVKHNRQPKCVRGKGFLDNVKNVIADNKDLIVKPLLTAAGELAAFGLTEGGKALIKHTLKKGKSPELDSKSKEILRALTAVPNTVGSGIKKL